MLSMICQFCYRSRMERGETKHTKSDGCDFHHGKDSHPVPARGNGLHASASPRRRDLTRVEPWDGKPSSPIEQLEDEYERCGTVCCVCIFKREQDRDHDEAKAQPDRADHKQCPPPETVHEQDGDRRPNQISALN